MLFDPHNGTNNVGQPESGLRAGSGGPQRPLSLFFGCVMPLWVLQHCQAMAGMRWPQEGEGRSNE